MHRPRTKVSVQFRERTDLLDFLLEVSTVIAETLDLDALLASVAGIVQRVIPYDLFAILLYNEKRQELRIRHAVGHREDVVRNLVIGPAKELWERRGRRASRFWFPIPEWTRDTCPRRTLSAAN